MTSSEIDPEFLRTAVERGYFKVPRETTLVDLADAHEMSDVEASERLRTGLDVALREYLDEADSSAVTDEE